MTNNQPGDTCCDVENLFLRIAQALAEKWDKAELETYLADLLMDNCGARQGFPAAVVEEPMRIDAILSELSDQRKRFLPIPDDADFMFDGL